MFWACPTCPQKGKPNPNPNQTKPNHQLHPCRVKKSPHRHSKPAKIRGYLILSVASPFKCFPSQEQTNQPAFLFWNPSVWPNPSLSSTTQVTSVGSFFLAWVQNPKRMAPCRCPGCSPSLAPPPERLGKRPQKGSGAGVVRERTGRWMVKEFDIKPSKGKAVDKGGRTKNRALLHKGNRTKS